MRAEVIAVSLLGRQARYLQLSQRLPGLLDELQVAIAAADEPDRPALYALLAEAYGGISGLAHQLGYADLRALTIDRIEWAARLSGDPLRVARTQWSRGASLLGAAAYDHGLVLMERTRAEVGGGQMGELDEPARSVYGSLHLRSAVLAARAGRGQQSAAHLAEAQDVAATVRAGANHYGMEFGLANVALHRVSVAVEMADGALALTRAGRWSGPAISAACLRCASATTTSTWHGPGCITATPAAPSALCAAPGGWRQSRFAATRWSARPCARSPTPSRGQTRNSARSRHGWGSTRSGGGGCGTDEFGPLARFKCGWVGKEVSHAHGTRSRRARRPAIRGDQGGGHHADDRRGPAGASPSGLAGRARRHNVIDMERELEVEVAAPVATAMDGDDQVLAGVLPSGRYATLRYTGHPDGLVGATASLLEWAARHSLTFDARPAEGGERWGARLEIYETDPAVEPDMSRWTTQLAFRLSD